MAPHTLKHSKPKYSTHGEYIILSWNEPFPKNMHLNVTPQNVFAQNEQKLKIDIQNFSILMENKKFGHQIIWWQEWKIKLKMSVLH